MGKVIVLISFLIRHTNGHQIKKVLSISSLKRNANNNHNEKTSPHLRVHFIEKDTGDKWLQESKE
jgi:hypothetical protein